MVSKIDLALVFTEFVGEAVFICGIKPVPVFKIIADGRSPVSEAIILHFKGDLSAFGSFCAESPIKPILRSVSQLIFENYSISGYLFYADISADEILMYLHICSFYQIPRSSRISAGSISLGCFPSFEARAAAAPQASPIPMHIGITR